MGGKVRQIIKGRAKIGRKGTRFGLGTQRGLAKVLHPDDWNDTRETPRGRRRKYYSWPNGHRSNPRPKS